MQLVFHNHLGINQYQTISIYKKQTFKNPSTNYIYNACKSQTCYLNENNDNVHLPLGVKNNQHCD